VSRGWKLALWGGGAIVVVNALLALLGSLTGGLPGGPTSSSYATGSDGLAAYASLVARGGHPVRRLREAAAGARLDPATTVVVLDPEFVTPDDARALRGFVTAGGRLVGGGTQSDAWLRRVLPGGPIWFPDGARSARTLAPVAELVDVRRVEATGVGSWRTLGPALPSLGGSGRTLLAVASIGHGRLVLLADASPLENEFLARADNAALGLGLAGPRGRSVVFAESYHGYGKRSGLVAIPSRWRALLLLGGGAVLALMLARGRRLGPAEPERRELAPPRRVYVDALAALLARTRDRPAIAAALRTRAEGVVARAGGAGQLSSAESLGLEKEEIAALLHPAPTDDGLLAAGRALARLERIVTRRYA
jgi:hypothetical protein